MKIMVTGASGLLGSDLLKVLTAEHEVVAIHRAGILEETSHVRWRTLDLTKSEETYTVVTRENPELVIHCAAYNDVDGCERNPTEAFRQNALTTQNLALACQRFDAALLYISTDYVFDGQGRRNRPYQEWETPHPLCAYAASKYWGEWLTRHLVHRFYIVRTSCLFGEKRATFVDYVITCAQEEKMFTVVEDLVQAPTYTPDLAHGLAQLIRSGRYGLYHLTNEGFCSRVELVQAVLSLHGIHSYKKMRRLRQANWKRPARRPPFSGLDNFMWRLEGFTSLRPWADALRDHFKKSKGGTG